MIVAGNKKPECALMAVIKGYYRMKTVAVINIKVNFLIRDIPQ